MMKWRHSFIIVDLGIRWEWSASRLGRFTPGETAPDSHWVRVWWASEPVWTLWRIEESLAQAGNRNPTVQPVARHYTARAITTPIAGLKPGIIVVTFVAGVR
jgi:hypothetical protein